MHSVDMFRWRFNWTRLKRKHLTEFLPHLDLKIGRDKNFNLAKVLSDDKRIFPRVRISQRRKRGKSNSNPLTS